jgi:site-specific recombinase XerD
MKRQANPQISSSGAYALAHYEQTLREREDLTPASVRNYLSDVRHFIAWFEAREAEHTADTQIGNGFDPRCITTPTLTRYRTSLQADEQQKPASVNRALISLKRYFGWASGHQLITNNPSTAVKLVGQEKSPPRHLDDQEEQALVATVTKAGILRDRVLIVLLLHTGLLHRLAQIMGHDSLDTTKLYVQGTKHDLQQAVETIAWT